MQSLKLISLLYRFKKVIVMLSLSGFYIPVAFSMNESFEKENGGVEWLRKSICFNGFLNSACTNESEDILFCAKNYPGDQAQKVCQYELGLGRRRTDWYINEYNKKEAIADEKRRILQVTLKEDELKRKISASQDREAKAQDCIKHELSNVRKSFKDVRDYMKSIIKNKSASKFDDFDPEFNYEKNTNVPGILSIDENVRPVLSTVALVFKIDTSCDSGTEYFGYGVSIDGKLIDGFLAFKKSPVTSFDSGEKMTEIIELEWLGPRIMIEAKRLKDVKNALDQENLKKRKIQESIKLNNEIKLKEQRDNNEKLFLLIIFLSIFVGIIFCYFKRKKKFKKSTNSKSTITGLVNRIYNILTFKGVVNNKVSSEVISNESTKTNNFLYSYEPSSINQIDAQKAFRTKYSFVDHNVRFEHMQKFIKMCNEHKTKYDCFPDRIDQERILFLISRDNY